MSSSSSKAWIGWLAIVVIVLGGLWYVFSGSSAPSVGTTNNVAHEEIIPWGFGGGFQLGPPSAAPLLKVIAAGTCNPTVASLPLAASTTAKATCTLSNAYNLATTDIVDITVPNPQTSYGFIGSVGGAVTTGGQAPTITFYYTNGTGAATSSFPAATTTVGFQVFRLF